MFEYSESDHKCSMRMMLFCLMNQEKLGRLVSCKCDEYRRRTSRVNARKSEVNVFERERHSQKLFYMWQSWKM